MNHQQGFEMPSQAVFDQQMDDMRAELREMRSAITQVATALTKLSVLEERNLVASAAIEKIAIRQERTDAKVNAVELEHAKFESKIGGIGATMKVMWAAFGGGVLYVGSQVIKQIAAG